MRSVMPVLMIALLLGGCTSTMWKRANAAEVHLPCVEGVLEPAKNDAGGRRLLISYWNSEQDGWGTPDRAFALLPLDADGRAPPPLRYEGGKRTSDEILDALTPEQRGAIRRERLRFINGCEASRIRRSSRFRPLNSVADGIWSEPFEVRPVEGIVLFAYWSYADGRPPQLIEWRENDAVLPRDCQVLLIPDTQPRPRGQRVASQIGAALLTPITLLGDAARSRSRSTSHASRMAPWPDRPWRSPMLLRTRSGWGCGPFLPSN